MPRWAVVLVVSVVISAAVASAVLTHIVTYTPATASIATSEPSIAATVVPQAETQFVAAPLRPSAVRVLDVRVGPNEEYAIVASFAKGKEVEVLGRDQTGKWIAVRVGPLSSLTGWVPAGSLTGLPDTSALSIAGLTPIAAPAGQAPVVVPGPVSPTRQAPKPAASSPASGPKPPSEAAVRPTPIQPPSPCQELLVRGYQNAKEREYFLRYCR